MGKEKVISEYLAALGRKGGKAASAALTKKQLVERARLAGKAAAAARAAKAKKGGRNAVK
jgi:hypothetical protein